MHPGMNKRSGWFDHDRDLVVVLVAKPIERHHTIHQLDFGVSPPMDRYGFGGCSRITSKASLLRRAS